MTWQKGESGNLSGRPVGSGNKLGRELREELAERGSELLQAAIAAALNGDTAILRFLLERLLPPAREDMQALEEWPGIQITYIKAEGEQNADAE